MKLSDTEQKVIAYALESLTGAVAAGYIEIAKETKPAIDDLRGRLREARTARLKQLAELLSNLGAEMPDA